MKKFTALILILIMCLSLCACGGSNQKAFEKSKEAYDNIDIAYEITDQFGSDVYEAWRLAIYEDDEILSDGCTYLATELNISEDEIREGIVYLYLCEFDDKNWEDVTEEEKREVRELADYSFSVYEDDLFSFCIMVVSAAYEANGKTAEAQTALDAAKAQMKELSENYSDYEHYPNLKGYYTTTSSFFQFCQNPDGSFEQIKTTLNDYRNQARDYISDLDYIFEE